MGGPGLAEKCRKTVTHGGGHRRLRRPDLGASAAVRRKIPRPGSSHLAPPPWPARVQGGWPESPPTAET